MATRKQIKERSSERVRRERAPIPWRYFLLSITCAVILATGFFYAAKQHFASVDYSMRNSDMRKAKEKLEAQHIKLNVERERAAAPATVEKAGLKMGLVKLDTQDFQFIDPAGNITVASNAKKPSDAKDKLIADKTTASKDSRSLITKTAQVEKKAQPTGSGKIDIAKLVAKETARPTIARK
jgi:Na+-transporting NADH:ubiquinone oxidoreductase subunit NqrC